MFFLNSYEQWSKEDETKLSEYYKSGNTIEEIGNIFKRSKISIKSKLKRMNILNTNKNFLLYKGYN